MSITVTNGKVFINGRRVNIDEDISNGVFICDDKHNRVFLNGRIIHSADESEKTAGTSTVICEDSHDENISNLDAFFAILIVAVIVLVVFGLITAGVAIIVPLVVGIALVALVIEGIATLFKKIASHFG